MKRVFKLLPALLLMLLPAAAPPVEAQAPVATIPQFSADMAMQGKNRRQSMAGKMYFGGDRWRMEMTTQGRKAIMIIDGKTEAMYMVMPEQRMYMELRPGQTMPGTPETPDVRPVDPNNPCADDPAVTCKKVGSEEVNGRSTDKWVFTNLSQQETKTTWVDQRLYLPVRTVHSNGSTMDLTNIEEGRQPAALFEVPQGYQKFDLGNMMKGMGRPPQ